jgi:hypothetical protein
VKCPGVKSLARLAHRELERSALCFLIAQIQYLHFARLVLTWFLQVTTMQAKSSCHGSDHWLFRLFLVGGFIMGIF